MQYVDGEICHIMKKPLKAGEQVVGRINWEWRFDLMQQHSGEHIVSGMIHEKYGYENVGFHMGEEVITIDLSGMLTEEQVAEIEQKVNDYIWMNQEVNIFIQMRDNENSFHIEVKRTYRRDSPGRISGSRPLCLLWSSCDTCQPDWSGQNPFQ